MKVKLTKFKLIKYSKCKWENNFVTNIVMANEFNSFFTRVGRNIADSVEPSKDYLPTIYPLGLILSFNTRLYRHYQRYRIKI